MRQLPPRTGWFYSRFIELANIDDLHPLDVERFYHFIWACHLGRTVLDSAEVRARLEVDGFDPDDAESLSTMYEQGRELLSYRRTMPAVNKSDWARTRIDQRGAE